MNWLIPSYYINITSDLTDSSQGTNVNEYKFASTNLSDPTDPTDLDNINKNKKDTEFVQKSYTYNMSNSKFRSDKSYRSDILSTQLYKCYYCNSEFSSKEDHLHHSINSHQDKPAQPEDKRLFEIMGIKQKGNPWEK